MASCFPKHRTSALPGAWLRTEFRALQVSGTEAQKSTEKNPLFWSRTRTAARGEEPFISLAQPQCIPTVLTQTTSKEESPFPPSSDRGPLHLQLLKQRQMGTEQLILKKKA